MNLRRYTFVQTIRFLLSAALILLTIAVIISQIVKSQHQANKAAEESRAVATFIYQQNIQTKNETEPRC